MKTQEIKEFEIHEMGGEFINHDMQYFVMYAMSEGENFHLDGMFGVWGEEQTIHIMNRFRQTGTLLMPKMGWLPPHRMAIENREDIDKYYDTVRPVSVYITKLSAAMVKANSYREVPAGDPRYGREDITEWPKGAHPRDLAIYANKNFPEPSL